MKEQTLLVLRGLPGSGKSTYAYELVAKGWKRVNKDDLRGMIDNSKWSKENERDVMKVEIAIAVGFINAGKNVVVDDTNFAWEDKWKELAEKLNVKFEVKFFDVPLMACIERDSKRGDKSVGAKVIQNMYDRFLKPQGPDYNPAVSDCYIFDIDGTLALMDGRSPYDYSKVDTDKQNIPIVNINKILGEFTKVIIVSGREHICIDETTKWLNDNGVKYEKIFTRETGDKRDDSIVKREIYEKNIKDKYNVLAVFDDRNRVVDMWRSLGLTCLQVYYGNF